MTAELMAWPLDVDKRGLAGRHPLLPVTITFSSTSVRYLRLNFTANSQWPAGQVSEFQVYGP
jgi:hypothetical protein